MGETWTERFERLLAIAEQQQAWKQMTVDFVEAAKLAGWVIQETKYKLMADLTIANQAPLWPLMEIWVDTVYAVEKPKKKWWKREP